jgi:hypothetical protein
MDEPFAQSWFLRKHDGGSVFGPLSFEQLALWASLARIAPNDLLSTDQVYWIKAPMLPQLRMDWLLELTSEHFYGPTTLDAILEFLRLGEINEETFVINTCNGTRRQLREMPALLEMAWPTPAKNRLQGESHESEPELTGISIGPQERIHDLEQSLRKERRALSEAEQRYADLEQKYRELLDR